MDDWRASVRERERERERELKIAELLERETKEGKEERDRLPTGKDSVCHVV